MPTLVRLLTTIALLAGAVLAVMTALVYLVQPVPHQIVIDVPLSLPGNGSQAERGQGAP